MNLRRAVGKLRWETISGLRRREVTLDGGPVACFTFDDFPKSALDVGGAILKSHGATGTFYAAMGLCGHENEQGPHFELTDLERLISDGHELGSHTLHHVSGRDLTAGQFLYEAEQGRAKLEDAVGVSCGQFSYPFGHATLGLKRLVGARFASCRGIVPGVNVSPADLNLLRANGLYSSALNLDAVFRIVAEAARVGGFLIFYTHDVRESPSRYGCTPKDLDTVVSIVARAGVRILNVGQVLSTCGAP